MLSSNHKTNKSILIIEKQCKAHNFLLRNPKELNY